MNTFESRLWTRSRVEAPLMMHADGYEWEHEVRVALPPSYDETDRAYPVLWVTDNALEIVLPISDALAERGLIPELILVSVGPPSPTTGEEFARRRNFDFVPENPRSPSGPGDGFFPGPQGDRLRTLVAEVGHGDDLHPGGADRFLDFLVDDVRAELASRYRMDPLGHGLIGMSGGGTFVGHALFARPGAFSRYLCGSPALYANDLRIFDLEEEYARTHTDFPGHVFFCAGDGELTEDFITAWGCVSSMARLVETLHVRRYPSLQLSAKIFPGATHGDVWPLLTRDGLLAVWGS